MRAATVEDLGMWEHDGTFYLYRSDKPEQAETDPDYVAVAKDANEFTDDDINAFIATYKAEDFALPRERFSSAWRALLNRIGIAITRDDLQIII